MVSEVFYRIEKKKRDAILSAAIDEFTKGSFAQAKVVNICENANIPRSTFYKYFNSVEDLYDEVIRTIMKSRKEKFSKFYLECDKNIIESSKYVLEEVLTNKEEYLLLKSLHESGYHKRSNIKKPPVKNGNHASVIQLVMKLIRQLAFDFYELKVPKKMIVQQFEDFINIIDKGYRNIRNNEGEL